MLQIMLIWFLQPYLNGLKPIETEKYIAYLPLTLLKSFLKWRRIKLD